MAGLCRGIVLGALKGQAEDAEDLLSRHAADAEDEFESALPSVAAACLDRCVPCAASSVA